MTVRKMAGKLAVRTVVTCTAIVCTVHLSESLDGFSYAFAENPKTEETTEAAIQWARDGKVAGRSLAQWNDDLSSDNELVRARSAKTLALFGNEATPNLAAALGDSSDAVVYWAACGLGMLDLTSEHVDYKDTIVALKEVESKAGETPSTAMAAAYALCRLEGVEGHIDLLIEQVQIPKRGVACSAADLLGAIGPDAKPALPTLRATWQKHAGRPGGGNAAVDYHIRGACANALRLIDANWKPPTIEQQK